MDDFVNLRVEGCLGEISLHNFSKTHGLVNTRDGECKVLHHRTHHSIGIRFGQCISVHSDKSSKNTYIVRPSLV